METTATLAEAPSPSPPSSSSRRASRARPTFQYIPLADDQSIRILTLEPGSGDDPLVGSLHVEHLGSRPEYEAISYVWGTGGRHSELICDGAALPLTQSISDALRRVRHPARARSLWADQICINQDDLPERSQQVKLMNAVYKNARRVLVWLGRDDDGVAAKAVSMIDKLYEVFADEERHKAFRLEYSENLARQSKEPWVPISKLTKLPWFHRIWIVQEIGTDAPATLYWGDAEMDWETLSSVAAVLNQNYHHLRSRFFIGTPNIRYLHKRFVEPEVEYDRHHNRGCFVYELHRARHLLAQDPRDHVYAFLGHFSLAIGGRGLAGLVADYGRPVEEVYIDVARRALQDADSLIMLSANHNHPSSSKRYPPDWSPVTLPSWVPDWRETPVHMLGSPGTPHRAAGDTKPDLRIDDDGRVLHIRGVHVDTIDRYSWTLYGSSYQFHHHRAGHDQGNRGKQHYNNHNNHNNKHTHHHNHHHHTPHNHHHNHSHTSNNWRSHNHNQQQQQQQQQRKNIHQSSSQETPSPIRTPPLINLWRSICHFSSFTLSHPYPPLNPTSSPSSSSPSSSSSSSAFFAFLQTLTNACIGADRSRPYSSIPITEWLANGAAYLLRSSPNPQDLDISPDLRALAHAGDPYQWTREATLVTRYRRFAITAKGYYVLGPDALQVGDVVVVLHGGRTPFILRRAEDGGDGWTLIGECYVHGLMNGEALNLQGAVEDIFSIS